MPTMLFKSGFENGVSLTAPHASGGEWLQELVGADNSGFNWASIPAFPGHGGHLFNYQVADTSILTNFMESAIVTVTGYDGNPTRALRQDFKGDDPAFTGGSRNQWSLQLPGSIRRIYLRYRAFLQPDLASVHLTTPPPNRERQFVEWRENGDVFRIHSSIVRKAAYPQLMWETGAQYGDQENDPPAWGPFFSPDYNSMQTQVPLGQWFTYENLWIGDPVNGRFYGKVNGSYIVDFYGQTFVNSGVPANDYLRFIWPFKIYLGTPPFTNFPNLPGQGGSVTLWQMIDDFEIWDDEPPPAGQSSTSGSSTVEQMAGALTEKWHRRS